MEKRIGVVGIIVEKKDYIARLNAILSEYADNIIGRMGVPYCKARNLSIISLIVQGTTDQIGALTGKLGGLEGISVKTALTKTVID